MVLLKVFLNYQTKYRDSPTAPFRPGFYRTPRDKPDERQYRLPSRSRHASAADKRPKATASDKGATRPL